MNKCEQYCRTIKRMCTDSGLLPYAYQQVEYLRGTGTQYIDTGVTASNDMQFVVKASKETSDYGGEGNVIIGQRGNTDQYLFLSFVTGNRLAVGYGVYANSAAMSIKVGVPNTYNAVFNDGTLTVYCDDNLILNHSGNPISSYTTIKLFALYNFYAEVVKNFLRGNIYSCKIATHNSNGDTVLLREYIPCYRKSDNKPGMYDLVTRAFFTNAGTGEFTVGADVN